MILYWIEESMSSIITAVFKATFGLLVNKARDKAAEKLKEGDVTDKRIRELIQREIDDIKSKLDGLARNALLAAIDAFEAGVKYLYQAVDADADVVMVHVGARERGNEASPTPTINTVALATEIGKVELTELNEETKRALFPGLSHAKKRFEMAREEATRAFNNEALSTLDRIKAIRYRVMAIMLESAVETVGGAGDLSSLSVGSALKNALPECEQCLQKLHSLPDVKKNFKVELDKALLNIKGRFSKDKRREIISTVCQVNRAIYDAARAAGKNVNVWIWPSVDTGEDIIDPLRDGRVAEVLRIVDMEHCCVTPWSFGQEGEEEHKLKKPWGIATNADGQFIVIDYPDKRVKVFDSSGKFVLQFCPEHNDTKTDFDALDVATDENSNIYVLVWQWQWRAGAEYEVQVFSPTADLLHKFFVSGGHWDRLAVTNNKVLVLRNRTVVDMYEHEGTYVCSFGEGMLNDAWDITAGPDRQVMILDRGNSRVFIFTDDGQQQCEFNINTKEDDYRRIACHPSGEHVVVAGEERRTRYLSVAIYTKDGEFVRTVRRIELHEEKIWSIRGITVSMEGHIAVAVKGKVIVL